MEKILTGKKTASWRDQFISNNNYAVKVIQRIIIEFSSHGNENGGGEGGINKLQKIRGRGRITQPPISRVFMNENWACQRKVFFFSPRDIAIQLFCGVRMRETQVRGWKKRAKKCV